MPRFLLRTQFFLFLAIAGALGNNRPNFIFILADDLGWGDLACYGHPYVQTPNLDALAANGMLFEQAYASGVVCGPSRVALISGRFPAEFGISTIFQTPAVNRANGMPDWLDPNLPTLPRLLRDAGYRTFHTGKWHLGNNSPSPDNYGYDDYRTRGYGDSSLAINSNRFWRDCTAITVDDALEFIAKTKETGEPFYIDLWTNSGHLPIAPLDESYEPYVNLEASPSDFPSPTREYLEEVDETYGDDLSDRFRRWCATLTQMDLHIGRLMKGLEEFGVADNTVVVFSSDNGPEQHYIQIGITNPGVSSAGPFRGRKRRISEGGIRMPFIVQWPSGILPNQRNRDAVIAGVDWLPTACDLAGVRVPRDLPGTSFAEALRSEPFQRESALFWKTNSGHIALRRDDWKYKIYTDERGHELHLLKDTGEAINLIDLAITQRQLENELTSWNQSLTPSSPTVTTSPITGSIFDGFKLDLEAHGTAMPPPSYRWYHDNQPLEESKLVRGVRSPYLTITHATLRNAGQYHCVIENSEGSIASEKAMVTVVAPTYETWSAQFGELSEQEKQPGADPDADGWDNLLEYALRMDPIDGDLSDAIFEGSNDGRLKLAFVRNRAAADLSYVVEAATSLKGPWEIAASSNLGGPFLAAPGFSVELDNTDGRVVVADSQSFSARGFFRLTVIAQ